MLVDENHTILLNLLIKQTLNTGLQKNKEMNPDHKTQFTNVIIQTTNNQITNVIIKTTINQITNVIIQTTKTLYLITTFVKIHYEQINHSRLQ